MFFFSLIQRHGINLSLRKKLRPLTAKLALSMVFRAFKEDSLCIKIFGSRGGGIETSTMKGVQKCQYLAKSEKLNECICLLFMKN